MLIEISVMGFFSIVEKRVDKKKHPHARRHRRGRDALKFLEQYE